jgi:hypothetical protein
MFIRRAGRAALAVPLLAAIVAPLLSCPAPDGRESMRGSVSDTLRLELEVPDEVQLGDPVLVVIRARNLTERVLSLHLLGTEIVYDILVWRMDGTLIYRRLEGQSVPMVLRIVTLEPREELTLRGTWNQRTSGGETVEPGSYRVQALLPTDEEPLSTPRVAFRIRR